MEKMYIVIMSFERNKLHRTFRVCKSQEEVNKEMNDFKQMCKEISDEGKRIKKIVDTDTEKVYQVSVCKEPTEVSRKVVEVCTPEELWNIISTM